ncbi:MAG: hypothetical protein AB4352_29660 [Hormoscilla sp.]
MEDFGIIIACCDRDYSLTKGCCASIRYFMGDVPICLLVDGTFSVSSLENIYGVKVINHNNVSHEVLRKRSFGWGITKMISFWYSPWETFLFLDADTILWGNVAKFANFQEYDAIIDKPCYEYSDENISKYFFDIKSVEKHFPDFNWQAHRDQFFCTGTFFARREMFSLEEYIEILDFTEKHPNIFKLGEMGFLNFMLFKAADEGRIRLGHEDMQVLVADFSKNELKQRFPITERGPVVQNEEAAVIHWAGAKRLLSMYRTYTEPMNFCRRQFLQQEKGYTGKMADVWLAGEDVYSMILKYKKKVHKKLKKFSKVIGK